MSDARIAEYLKTAAQMREAAERTFDPQIAAEYLALASKWLRLADQVRGGAPHGDQPSVPLRDADGDGVG